MKKYKHIFFDLDNTLWDFENNSTETLTELFHHHQLKNIGIQSAEVFIEKYKLRNQMMWEQYRMGKIEKATLRNDRFTLTFWDMGIDTDLVPLSLADDYVYLSPRKNRLFPYAIDTLNYLSGKYQLHIITNGFEEAQTIKLKSSDLEHLFDHVIISEHTGFKKPDVNIFNYALAKTSSIPDECLMIGDGLEIDVLGALNAGWDAVFFNPGKIAHDRFTTYEINCLSELKQLL